MKKKFEILIREAIFHFKRQVLSRRNIRYFIYYAAANFTILTLYSFYQSLQPVDLNLKPVTSPAVEGSFLLFLAAVILLPFSLFLEECGFRLLPMVMIRDVMSLNKITVSVEHNGQVTTVHNSSLRLWIYHHWWIIFIVVSAIWAAFWHQINVVESSLLGSLIYFGVQFFSGICFAWIYLKRGLGASWIVHTAWDLFIVVLNLLMIFSQQGSI